MKLRTTPASTQILAKSLLVLTVITLAFIAPTQSTIRVSADQYDDKISILQQNISAYQAEADRLNNETATLQNALAQLANQKAEVQAQIDLNQTKYDQLVIEIADTEKKIKDSQDALGETIADLYVDQKISPLEMLASSKNISDYLDKQEYRNSVRDQLTSTIKDIKDLKAKLDQQKVDVEKILTEQKSNRDTLVVKESEQQSLLNKTQNSEVAYQNLIKDSAAQIAAAKATQAAIRARANSTGGYTLVDAGSLPGYPWNSSNCPMQGYMSTEGSNGNGGDGHGYGCRQCVSYVAYRVAQATGFYYDDLGNGGSAAYNLVHKHGWTDLGGTPQPGSVASLWGITSAPYSSENYPGHTAYVEDVSADGSQVLVSQYNYDYGAGYGMYSEMWLSTNFFHQYAQP